MKIFKWDKGSTNAEVRLTEKEIKLITKDFDNTQIGDESYEYIISKKKHLKSKKMKKKKIKFEIDKDAFKADPSYCVECGAKLKKTKTTFLGTRLTVFRCVKCKEDVMSMKESKKIDKTLHKHKTKQEIETAFVAVNKRIDELIQRVIDLEEECKKRW